MPDLRAIWTAGRVMRWHTHPHLAGSGDRLDGHHARVARIILALHPSPSVDLLRAALTHDDGESVTGDRPYTAARLPEADAAEKSARQKIWDTADEDVLSNHERDWLRMADLLDAYMWAHLHAPQLLLQQEWVDHRDKVMHLANSIGVAGKVKGAIW